MRFLETAPIHERKGRRMEPLFWILTFEAMTLLILFAAALVAGPVFLAVYFKTWWSFILLLLAPLGLWLIGFSLRFLRKRIWHNRHLSCYRLYQDRIDYLVYTDEAADSQEGTVSLRQIEETSVSLYIAKNHYAYKKTGWTEPQPYDRMLPILYVRYHGGWNPRILSVPLHDYREAEIWLSHLQDNGIPLRHTRLLLSERPEDEQLRLMNEEESSIPYSFSGNLEADIARIIREQQAASTTREVQPTPQGPVPIHLNPAGKPKAKKRLLSSFFAKPRASTIALFGLLFAALYLLIKLAAAGGLSQDNMGICLTVLLVFSAIYFLLAQPLAFRHPIRFIAIAFIGWLAVGTVMTETDAGVAQEFHYTAISATMLMAVLVWLPYGIIHWLRARRKAR